MKVSIISIIFLVLFGFPSSQVRASEVEKYDAICYSGGVKTLSIEGVYLPQNSQGGVNVSNRLKFFEVRKGNRTILLSGHCYLIQRLDSDPKNKNIVP